MRRSHESLRLDYEISTEKLDASVAITDEVPGIYGSRLTGAGFGGSTIHFADPASAERIQPVSESPYRDRYGQPLPVRVLYRSDGAGEVESTA